MAFEMGIAIKRDLITLSGTLHERARAYVRSTFKFGQKRAAFAHRPCVTDVYEKCVKKYYANIRSAFNGRARKNER